MIKLKETEALLPPLSAAKWLKVFLLVDEDEMRELFLHLQEWEIHFFQVQGITKRDEGVLSREDFLALYSQYIASLKAGEIPTHRFQKEFALALSRSVEALYSYVLADGRRIIKPLLPIIQIQLNRVRYSKEDGSFRCQVYGEESFTWGLLLSYPQIYQDPNTHAILDTFTLPNGPLFKAIQKWVRNGTRATPFNIEGKKQNEPIRLGKKCFSWINNHPELKKFNLSVYVD